MNKKEIIEKLEAITKEPGFIYTLAILLKNDLFFDANEAADINWRQRLSFQEFNFLIGLFVKSPIEKATISKEQMSDQIKRIYETFDKLHAELNRPFIEAIKKDFGKADKLSKEEKNDLMKQRFGSGETMLEAIFYGNSGAYDFEYWDFAPKKYKYDYDWLKTNRGLEIQKASEISSKLKTLSEEKLRNLPKPKNFNEYIHSILGVFIFKKTDLKEFDEKTVEGVVKNFSIKPGGINSSFKNLGDYNVIESHPIIELEEDEFFLPICFSLAQSTYESPFYWMMDDEKYKETSSKNRGITTEEIAIEMLQKVFGTENVFKNIKIKKNKKTTITDIDVLALAGNKAVILQAKCKKLTELSKKGDKETLKKDFQDAVQKAYDQGLLCREALLKGGNKLIDENNKELVLKEAIDDAYIICLTSDTYPAVTHQVDVYLEKKVDDPFPVAISVFDLDIVSFYLQDPFDFLYYLRQRIDLSGYFKGSSEMALLGYHLNQKLFKTPATDLVSIDESMGQLIDANFPALKGHQPKTQAVHRLHHSWNNPDFQKLIEEVKHSEVAGFTDAIFYFYDLAGSRADKLIEAINTVKRKTSADHIKHDMSLIFDDGKSGVSFICQANSPETLGQNVFNHAIARKYKTKANIWVGIGSMINSKKMVDSLVFSKEKWTYDENMEKFEKIALKRGVPVNTFGKKMKKLGRNDPCFCGSGKKYKKCCLNI